MNKNVVSNRRLLNGEHLVRNGGAGLYQNVSNDVIFLGSTEIFARLLYSHP